ncbi:MAG: hypothetical protein CSA97_03115 [Bacteroidetes bacterium]|nr:MAG: hypothetical protein CSA97_03115 [Bacteroidota bacterium]
MGILSNPKRTLRFQLTVSYVAIFSLVFTALFALTAINIYTSTWRYYSSQSDRTVESARCAVESFVDKAVETATSDAHFLAINAEHGNQVRKEYRELLKRTLQDHKSMFGAYTQVDPDMLDTMDAYYRQHDNSGPYTHFFTGWFRKGGTVHPRLWDNKVGKPSYDYETSELFLNRTYFKKIREGADLYITDVYVDVVDGVPVEEISIVKSIDIHGKPVGCVVLDMDFNALGKALDAFERDENEQMMTIGEDGKILIASNKDLIGTNLSEQTSDNQQVASIMGQAPGVISRYRVTYGDREYMRTTQKIELSTSGRSWIVIVDVPMAVLYSALWAATGKTSILFIVGALVFFFVSHLISRKLSAPVSLAVKQLMLISEGILQESGEHIQMRNRELASLATGVLLLRMNLRETVTELVDYDKLLTQSNKLFTEISQQLNLGGELQSQSVQEIHQSINTISESMADSVEATLTMLRIADTNAADLNDLSNASSTMVERMAQVNELISVVQSIAGQTNILALNAAVEAARAGEHGRGFAVVASEVRNLAEKSAEMAESIARVISQGMEASSGVDQHVAHIKPNIEKGKALAESISQQEQARSEALQQIENAVEQLVRVSEKNISQSNKIDGLHKDLLEVIEKLHNRIGSFEL